MTTMTPREPERRMEKRQDPKRASTSETTQSEPEKRGMGKVIGGMAAAVALVAGIGYGALNLMPSTATTTSPVVATGLTTTTGDGVPWGGAWATDDTKLTDKDWANRKAEFESKKAQVLGKLDTITTAAALPYLDQVVPAGPKHDEIKQKLQDGSMRMVAIGVYDNCAEDGDVVQVTGGGVSVTVPIFHRVQYVQIPVPANGQTMVAVTGVEDGGGGVTVGIVTPGGEMPVPYLDEGQTISFAVQ